MVTAEPQLHLRWHSHSATFTSMLAELHDSAPYSDVELCCNGGRVQAHRAVLSLCSPFLASVLSSLGNSSPTESFHPGGEGGRVRMLLPEVPVQDVQYLVSFIYCGQVDVPQAHIASFLNTGKHLHVLGLEQGDRLVASPEPSEGSNSSCAGTDAEEDAPSCPSRASSCASRPLSRSSTPHSQSDGGLSAASSTASSSLLMTLQSQQLNQAMLQQLHQQQLQAAAAGHGAKDVSDVNANLTPQKGLLGADINTRQHTPQGRGMKNEIKLKLEAMDEDKELPLNPQVFIKEERKTDRDDEDEDTSLTLKHSVFSNTPHGASNNNNLYNSTTTSDPVSGAAVTSAASDTSDTSSGGTSYGEEGAVGFPNVGCIIGSDGRIDLNYYLQQAIQCASMPCPLCKKEFKSQSGLRDHIRLHTGERPFICEFCHMNFARASHLKRHRRMHTGEKPFECRVCGKDFSRGDKLKDHLKRHEAEEKLNKIRKQIFTPEECSSDAAPSGLSAISSSLMPPGANGPQVASGGEPTPGGGMVNGDCGIGGVKTSSSLTVAASAAAASESVGGMSVGDTLSSIGEHMANLVARVNPQAVTPDSVMSAKTAVTTSTATTVAASIQQQIQQHQLQQMQQQQQHNLQQQAQLLQQQQLALRQQSTEQLLRRPALPLPNNKKRKTQHTVSSSSNNNNNNNNNNNVIPSLSSASAAANTINMITSAASRLSNNIPSVSNYSSLANNISSSISCPSSASNNINSVNSIASLNSLMQSVTSNGALSISAGGFHQLQSGGVVSSSSSNQVSGNNNSSSSNNASTGITPQMLGIASIGECILRPIN